MRRVAVFDFDGTLIEGDSFMPFLSFACGPLAAYATAVEALGRYALQRLCNKPTESMRTFVKGFLIKRLLAGRPVASLATAIEKVRCWMQPNEAGMRALRDHKARGDMIVIASGSLDLYLPSLLRDVPYDALLCTDVDVKDGVIVGDMINGNCVRRCKAERLKAWLEKEGPFDDSYGYGNYPHDLPMLDLVQHRVIVS